MYKFIILTFLFLGWAFYEMSGGNDFVPMSAQVEQPESTATEAGAAQAAAAPAQVPVVARIEPEPAAEVTRAAYSAEPSFDIRKPDEDELAAVDPAVIASFGRVLNGEETTDGVIPASETPVDLRLVSGNNVNMRNGPGTSYSVVGRLTRGEEVEVLSDPGNGCLKLRVAETGNVGWMADFLVSAAN